MDCLFQLSASYREVLKNKINSIPEKKRSEERPKPSENKPSNQKITPQEVKEKEVKMKKSEERQTGGKSELNELMTRVLEEELQALLMEVWQELPDDPPSDTEQYVTDKFREEVSDELRNVIGLNVTKRLLNVHNPLLAKINFSCRPESGYLTKFLDKYKIRSFKRIDRATNTFAVRLATISDFDYICTKKNICCGSAKITVEPFYRFTDCPRNLKTIFNDDNLKYYERITEKDKELKELDKKGEEITTRHDEGKVKDDKNKIEEKPNSSKVSKVKENPKKVEFIDNNDKVCLPKDSEVVKNKENVIQKETKSISEDKSKVREDIDNKTKTPSAEPAQKSIPNKGSTQKTSTNCQTKQSVQNPSSIANSTEKTSNTPKIVNAKATTNTTKVETNEKLAKIDDVELIESEDNEFDAEFDECDEMDDDEILALISSGVIVDQCSGSGED